MSGSNLTPKELDNILITYEQYGAEHLGDYIRAIWKEAWDEGHDAGYKLGSSDGFNMGIKSAPWHVKDRK